jgi:triosephosphate isomerase
MINVANNKLIYEGCKSMKKLIAGNWKMNMNSSKAKAFDEAMVEASTITNVDWLICPPYPYITHITNAICGAQDCSAFDKGAYTGDVSAAMLKDIGCDYCIVGHSERRAGCNECSEDVRGKATQVIDNEMIAIICVGETLDEREDGKASEVVKAQLIESLPTDAKASNAVIAYEPVWAIGTGKAATACDVSKMHNHIRDILKEHVADGDKMRILYGGSLKPENAAELLNIENVNGALIGGASLKAEDFIAIGKAAE